MIFLNPVELQALTMAQELNERVMVEAQKRFNGLVLAIFEEHDEPFPTSKPRIDLQRGVIEWEEDHDGGGTEGQGSGTAIPAEQQEAGA